MPTLRFGSAVITLVAEGGESLQLDKAAELATRALGARDMDLSKTLCIPFKCDGNVAKV